MTDREKLNEALQVLADLFEEQDMRWMIELSTRRNQVKQWLLNAERHCECLSDYAEASTSYAFHNRTCDLALCLRAVGGPVELVRQTNGAHEEALIDLAMERRKQEWNDRREAEHWNRV